MTESNISAEGNAMEKFRLENGTLRVKTNLYPYLLREFDALCQRLLKFPNRVLYADLTGCNFISTVFLSTLIKTHLEAQRQSRSLILLIGPDLEQFFVYASLDKTFNIEKRERDDTAEDVQA